MVNKNHSPSAQFVTSIARAYGSELHGFLVKRLRRDQDAADVAQEVYLRLLRLKSSELVRQPHAYVYFVASQVVADLKMRTMEHPVTYDSELVERWVDDASRSQPDEIAEQLDARRELAWLLRRLPVNHRNVLLLRKRDGLSWTQIGERLGFSVHTVKKYLYEASARIGDMKWKR